MCIEQVKIYNLNASYEVKGENKITKFIHTNEFFVDINNAIRIGIENTKPEKFIIKIDEKVQFESFAVQTTKEEITRFLCDENGNVFIFCHEDALYKRYTYIQSIETPGWNKTYKTEDLRTFFGTHQKISSFGSAEKTVLNASNQPREYLFVFNSHVTVTLNGVSRKSGEAIPTRSVKDIKITYDKEQECVLTFRHRTSSMNKDAWINTLGYWSNYSIFYHNPKSANQ